MYAWEEYSKSEVVSSSFHQFNLKAIIFFLIFSFFFFSFFFSFNKNESETLERGYGIKKLNWHQLWNARPGRVANVSGRQFNGTRLSLR